MKVAIFSCKDYEKAFLAARNYHFGFELEYLECSLSPETVAIAKPFDAVSVFTEDILDQQVLDTLKKCEVNHIALRCRGSSNIDVAYAKQIGICISRVVEYSSTAVAEHTIALIMTLNRNLINAYPRGIDNNIELHCLLGFNLKSKTVGVIGTGAIGQALIQILNGFGCRVLCYDIRQSKSVINSGNEYVGLERLLRESDVITLHCTLTPESKHIIDHNAFQHMKQGVMIINTSRGDLINTQALIAGLKSQKVGYLGIDICEMESDLTEHSIDFETISPDVYNRLATFSNVLITTHKGYFTEDSLVRIAETTLLNLQYFFAGKVCQETFL